MTIHNFSNSLAKSHAHADASWWLDVYRAAFPDLASAVCVRNDGWAQRGGIDRVLTLKSGKTLSVDEKVRDKVYPDICLEYWSDRDCKTPGWVAKDLATDFIAYAFVPSRMCYLLPFQTLRLAWRANHREWIKKHPKIVAKNEGWVTVSVGVPIPVLMEALSNAMVVMWRDPKKEDAA